MLAGWWVSLPAYANVVHTRTVTVETYTHVVWYVPDLMRQGERPWYTSLHMVQNTYKQLGHVHILLSMSRITGHWQDGRGQYMTSAILSKLVCSNILSYLRNNSFVTSSFTCKTKLIICNQFFYLYRRNNSFKISSALYWTEGICKIRWTYLYLKCNTEKI